ncbi:hypothetical protein Sked_06230 [Sanguibacter keddieii DSM 10542]|uniref:Uncharacterized protein n=1 Tax=Sanguibacter keddieii (strain ATCC 51767 / DSM 10542 / NCFB 3025 / ST-74) TaxID=446469 RepID=D1BAN2_SANKS|nr:hypothetical protein Sked_06230 [Sanguibacter keddieii DSM 10542]
MMSVALSKAIAVRCGDATRTADPSGEVSEPRPWSDQVTQQTDRFRLCTT